MVPFPVGSLGIVMFDTSMDLSISDWWDFSSGHSTSRRHSVYQRCYAFLLYLASQTGNTEPAEDRTTFYGTFQQFSEATADLILNGQKGKHRITANTKDRYPGFDIGSPTVFRPQLGKAIDFLVSDARATRAASDNTFPALIAKGDYRVVPYNLKRLKKRGRKNTLVIRSKNKDKEEYDPNDPNNGAITSIYNVTLRCYSARRFKRLNSGKWHWALSSQTAHIPGLPPVGTSSFSESYFRTGPYFDMKSDLTY